MNTQETQMHCCSAQRHLTESAGLLTETLVRCSTKAHGSHSLPAYPAGRQCPPLEPHSYCPWTMTAAPCPGCHHVQAGVPHPGRRNPSLRERCLLGHSQQPPLGHLPGSLPTHQHHAQVGVFAGHGGNDTLQGAQVPVTFCMSQVIKLIWLRRLAPSLSC